MRDDVRAPSDAPTRGAALRRVPSLLLLAAGALLLTAPASRALDGSADVRQSNQQGRTEEISYSTRWRRETISARQSIRIASHFFLEGRFRGGRELSDGDQGTPETRQITRAPDVSLHYRTQPLQAGVKAGYLDRTAKTDGDTTSEVTRRQITAWLNAQLSSGTRLSSQASRTVTETTDALDETNENRQTSGFVLAEQNLGGSWSSQYRFSGLAGDVTQLGSSRDQTTHALELRGSPRSDSGRLASTLRARSQLFDQHREVDTGTETTRFATPLDAGLTYDDTPEALDPLEGAVLPAPGLADGDRTTPTPINLGDSAPIVREFGGDYRNLQFDFGESQRLESVALYVDRRLIQAQLFRWIVYVSDDPEGRLWTQVPDAQVTVTYREWAALLQGWEVRFVGDVGGRYVKLVDQKLGVTEPDILVTEMEVIARVATGVATTDDRTFDHNLDASLSFDATERVRLSAQSSLRRRDEVDGDADLTGVSNSVSARWTDHGLWAVYGGVDQHRLDGPTRAASDVLTLHGALSRGEGSDLASTISFSTAWDRGRGQDQRTDTYDLLTRWRALPRLHLSQRVSHGRRRDDLFDITARSVTLTHTMRSSPFTTLTVNLDRSDRWTSQTAGSGFTRFHDTEVDVIWAAAPLVTVSGDVLVRERDETDWSTRQSLTWSPLPGRKVETHISGSSFYDSRTRVQRLGADVATKWKPYRPLVVEASVGVQRYRVGDERSTPINTYLRAGYTF